MSERLPTGSTFLQDLQDAAQQNPIPTALIGIGIAWLFAGSSSQKVSNIVRRAATFDPVNDPRAENLRRVNDEAHSRLSSGVQSAAEGLNSATHFVRDRGAETVDSLSQASKEYTDSVSRFAKQLPDTGGEVIGNARSTLADLFQRQPLALGAVGVAIGASIAASFAKTDVEADYFGSASDTLKEKASSFVATQADHIADVAERTIDAATDEARRQGLTLENAKSTFSDVSAKAGRIVDTATQNVGRQNASGTHD
jgi:hypothetical protein